MDAKDYLAALRALKLTQVQIATRTKIPQSTISKIERGEVVNVRARTYCALQALHIELTTAKVPANA